MTTATAGAVYTVDVTAYKLTAGTQYCFYCETASGDVNNRLFLKFRMMPQIILAEMLFIKLELLLGQIRLMIAILKFGVAGNIY